MITCVDDNIKNKHKFIFGVLNYITYTNKERIYEKAKSNPTPNILKLKMATFASTYYYSKISGFKRHSQFLVYKKSKTSQRVLFCTEVQENEFMCEQVHRLFS